MIQNCIIFLCLSCLVRFNAFRYNIRQQSWSKFSIPSSISKRSSQRIMETQRLESNKLKSSIANIQTIRSRNRIFEQLLRFVKWNEFFPRISSIVISLVEPTVAGGVLSGGLHAISGPDHMAALLPLSIGKSGWYGSQLGAVWGIGHGLSSIALGLVAFSLKGKINSKFAILEKVSNLAELVVGASLIAIGAIGIKESSESAPIDSHAFIADDTALSSASTASTVAVSYPTLAVPSSIKNTFLNGVLHGFSLDGAPSLLPALAMPSWGSALTFLLAYSFGTMATMSIATGSIADLSLRLGKMVNDPALPKRLSFFSSLIAIAIGAFWILQATVLR